MTIKTESKIKSEFKFNPNASYKSGASYSLKKINLVKQDIYVNRYKSFPVSFPDIFQNYQNPTLHANAPWNTWKNSSFDWWQCQLNFAVWCATAGCGVSYEDHLRDEVPKFLKRHFNSNKHSLYISCLLLYCKNIKRITITPTDRCFILLLQKSIRQSRISKTMHRV